MVHLGVFARRVEELDPISGCFHKISLEELTGFGFSK